MDKVLQLMRGDTFEGALSINIGTTVSPVYYSLGEQDMVYVALMEPNQAFEDAIVKQTYNYLSETDDNGDLIITLDSKDTEYLSVGTYYLTAKLRYVDAMNKARVKTILPPTIFTLLGNNPVVSSDEYYNKNEYIADEIILDGGEIV